MTMSVKLAPEMEQKLRRRSLLLRKPASALIREALAVYLDTHDDSLPSAYALGAHVFGKHRGSPDLASARKRKAADLWSGKRRARSAAD